MQKSTFINVFHQHEKLSIAVIAFCLGVLFTPLLNLIDNRPTEFLSGLVPEAVGIVFTVVLIDRLNRYRADQRLKKQLIEELGSRINSVAINASEKLWANQWWADGSLAYAQLERADLRGVDFGKANLTSVRLHHPRYGQAFFDETSILPDETKWSPEVDLEMFTNPQHENYWRGYGLRGKAFKRADFSKANLRGADLRKCDLSGANLSDADLRGARLEDSKLQNADLRGASFDEHTILPDGKLWAANSDFKRFGASIIDIEEA